VWRKSEQDRREHEGRNGQQQHGVRTDPPFDRGSAGIQCVVGVDHDNEHSNGAPVNDGWMGTESHSRHDSAGGSVRGRAIGFAAKESSGAHDPSDHSVAEGLVWVLGRLASPFVALRSSAISGVGRALLDLRETRTLNLASTQK
jgi:hypothetical protein